MELQLSGLQKNGGQSSIKQFAKGQYGEDYNKYDTEILGLVNYWNHKLGASVDANVIKAMARAESQMGYISGSASANGSIDIMQVLDVRNPAIQRLAAEGNFDPNEGKMPKKGYSLFKQLVPFWTLR